MSEEKIMRTEEINNEVDEIKDINDQQLEDVNGGSRALDKIKKAASDLREGINKITGR